MKKERVNRIRATISSTICIMCGIVCIIIFICSILVIHWESKELNDSLDLLAFHFGIIFGPILLIVELCGNKKYGPIRYSSEYRIPTKISYKSDITERLLTYLKNNKYKKGSCSLTTMNLDYYIKRDKNDDVHIYTFLKSNRITQDIVNDYKKHLIELQDYLADNEDKIINGWIHLHIYFIAEITKNTKVAEELVSYNLINPDSVVLMPILINTNEKNVYIGNYNDGLGELAYKHQKKVIEKNLKTLDKGTIPLDE